MPSGSDYTLPWTGLTPHSAPPPTRKKMKHELHMSDPGRKALEGREGKRNHAYPDPATGGNPWTIGYGQTGPDIHPGLYWTDEQCDAALSRSLSEVFDPALNAW
jgi:lysozyme